MGVLVPVEMDRDQRIVAFPPNPRPLATLLDLVLDYVVVLLENFVDAIVVDRDPVSFAQDVCDGGRTLSWSSYNSRSRSMRSGGYRA